MEKQATGLPSLSPSQNPSNVPEKRLPARDRIPMSLPMQKLAAPDIPGFHCHWMKGAPQRIHQALRAGYEFVSPDEVDLNTFGLANGEDDSGNQDLGSRVSFIAGTDEQGKAERLYLMKLPLEWWNEDQAKQAERQEAIAGQLRGDKGFTEAGADSSHRYAKPGNADILTPKPR